MYVASGESYEISSGSSTSSKDVNVSITDYKLSEMTLVRNNERYKLNFNNGISETFDSTYGVILTREDRFGNKINFEYEEIEYFKGTFEDYFYSPASYIDTLKALSKITDSVGNEVEIAYDREHRWNGIYITGLSVYVNGELYSEIKLGNNKNSYGDYSFVESITEYLDDEEKMTTSFAYESRPTKIYNEDAGTYTLLGENLLMTKVSYPTGGSTSYTYEVAKRKYRDGNYDVYKVRKSVNSEKMITEYDYDGDYSFYPHDEFYRTIVTKYVDSECRKGSMTTYEFDSKRNLVAQTITDITDGKNIYTESKGALFKTVVVGKDLYRFDLKAPYITAYKQTEDGEYTVLKPFYIGKLSENNYIEDVKKVGDELFVFVDYYVSGGGDAKYRVASYNLNDDSWTARKSFTNEYERTLMKNIYYNGNVFYMPMRKGTYFYHMTYDPVEDSWFMKRQSSSRYSEYGVQHIGNIGNKAYYRVDKNLLTYDFEDNSVSEERIVSIKGDQLKSGFVKNGEIILNYEQGFRKYDPDANTCSDAVPYPKANINGYINGPGNTLYYIDPSEKRTIYSYELVTQKLSFIGKRMFINNDNYDIIQTENAIYLNTGGRCDLELEKETEGFEKISLTGGNSRFEIISNTYDKLNRITESKKTVYRDADEAVNSSET